MLQQVRPITWHAARHFLRARRRICFPKSGNGSSRHCCKVVSAPEQVGRNPLVVAGRALRVSRAHGHMPDWKVGPNYRAHLVYAKVVAASPL